MPTVRTRCPHCEVVTLDAADVTVRPGVDGGGSEAVFVCPVCTEIVVQRLESRMVPVLIGAGCRVEEWTVTDARALHPSQANPSADEDAFTGAITEQEIQRFVASLDRRDWFEQLQH